MEPHLRDPLLAAGFSADGGGAAAASASSRVMESPTECWSADVPLGLLKAAGLQLFFCFFFCFFEACLLPPLAPVEPVLNNPRNPPAPPPSPSPAPDAPSSSMGAEATSSSSCPLRKPPMSSPVALRFVAVERSPVTCARSPKVRLQRCKQSRRNQ